MEPLDDAKFSGTKEVAEHLTIEVSNLQPWIDEFVPGAGKINSIEQFKGGQSNPTYKIVTESKNLVLRSHRLVINLIEISRDLLRGDKIFRDVQKNCENS